MSVHHNNNIAHFIHKIESILLNELVIDTPVINYIESTFGTASMDTIQTILENEAECEREPMIELLLFPTKSIQESLEPCLENSQFQTADEQIIKHYFSRHRVKTAIHHMNRLNKIEFNPPISAVEQFITRLNIHNNPPMRMVIEIRENIPSSLRDRVKVCLRNRYHIKSDRKSYFLGRFLKKWDSDMNCFFPAFDFLLSFINEIPNDTAFHDALIQKKDRLKHALYQSNRLESELKSGNMETMILTGKRITAMNQKELCDQINWIEYILHRVYNAPEVPKK